MGIGILKKKVEQTGPSVSSSVLSKFDNSQGEPELGSRERSLLEMSGGSLGFKWSPVGEGPLRGWEKKWEEVSQKVMAEYDRMMNPSVTDEANARSIDPLGGGLSQFSRLGTRGVGKFALDMTVYNPALRYVLPSERDKLEGMNEDERATALIQNAMVPMIYGGMRALGGWWKEGKALRYKQMLEGKNKIRPVEDALSEIVGRGGTWKGFDYGESLGKYVKGKGFAKDEWGAVKQSMLENDSLPLKAVQWEKIQAGKKMSKGWQNWTVANKKAYGGPELHPMFKDLGSEANRAAKHWEALYIQNAKKANLSVVEPNRLIRAQARSWFGEDIASKINISMLDEKTAANFIASILDPNVAGKIARASKMGGNWMVPWIRPERFIFGAGEERWGVMSNVFNRIVSAYGNVQKYTTARVQGFAHMLEQGGFGKVATDANGRFKFIPNKATYNRKTTQAAKEFLEKTDDLFEVAKREGTQKAQQAAAKTYGDMVKQLREDTPLVAKLVDTTHVYMDQRYLEMITQFVPKVLNKYPTTDFGRAVIDDIVKRHTANVTEMFASGRVTNYTDKLTAVKKMFGEIQDVLSKHGDKIYEKVGKGVAKTGRTTVRGMLKPKEVAGEIAYQLSYGKQFPAYVQGYFPRIGKGIGRKEVQWSQALIGRPGYMKGRKLGEAQERLDDFAGLIEARTRSQGKQLYLMDEIEAAVKYAQRLPGDWREHTEFLISRAMGRPSKVDDIVSRMISSTPWTKNWDPYRVSKTAKSFNGLAYGGLLGFRPFAAMRNLTQPIINGMA